MKKMIKTILTAATVILTAAGCGKYADAGSVLTTDNIPESTNLSAQVKASAVSDYIYTVHDVMNLQSFLLTGQTEDDLTEKSYDLTGNDRWDVIDLCLMKGAVSDTLPLNSEKSESELLISVNGHELTASFADSTAAAELAEKLKAEPVTVSLNEYGGFEKVGKLPWALTTTDEKIDTEPCDIMLYQGNQMTIFYNSNSWSYTKLGHIDNMTQEELKAILGEGDVSVTLSLK